MVKESYTTYKGIECLNSCIYNYLKNDGFEICLSDIFFGGRGLDMRYTGMLSERMLYSYQYKSNFKFINLYLKDSIVDNYVAELYDMKEFLINSVKNNEKIILRVSSSNLPYNKVFDKNKIISHYVNVIDYDLVKDVFIVSDGCVPVNGESIYQGETAANVLIENWRKMNGEYLILQYNEYMAHSLKKDSYKVFKKQIRNYIKSKNHILGSRYKGMDCILSLQEDMYLLFEKQSDDLQNIVIDIRRQLNMEGFMQAKYYIYDKMCDICVSDEICKAYEENICNWNKVIFNFVKAGLKKNMEEYQEVVRFTSKLNEEERKILSRCQSNYIC